ncbi:MAG: gliding motility protein GldL [Duncaniella sp.]|nr:gliding motility protein GldL [Duncaniella sp.]
MTTNDIKLKLRTLMKWEGGQRLFNFAFSIGAAIVILGALFMILHLQGGNTLLLIGMGTEVLMFVITAFDSPPKEYHRESDVHIVNAPEIGDKPQLSSATQICVDQMAAIVDQLAQLQRSTESLNDISSNLLNSYSAIDTSSNDIMTRSPEYMERLESLSHNINGLNTIYEIQLKSISSQLDAIERINNGIKDIRDMFDKSASHTMRYCEETEKMARYIQQINRMYERTLDNMTINLGKTMTTSQP